MYPSIQIPKAEFEARAQKLVDYLGIEGLSGAVLFDNYYVSYFTDFAFIPTERPVAFAVNAQGGRALFVPRLELEHAQAEALLDRVDHYPEYPDDPHPMVILKTVLEDMGIACRIGADTDGYPWILGYQGPSLSELTGAEVARIGTFVEAQMAVKSATELALIRESAKWGNLAHRLLQRYTRVGATETEVSLRASQEATLALVDTLGPLYRARSMFSQGAEAGYRGQIGRKAAIPHALAMNATFMTGDVLVTGASAAMWGYQSELERTMIIGSPSDEQRRFFAHMLAAQEAAFEALRPEAKCSDVDQAVRRYYEAHDLMPYWKHHTGHGIGLRYHEGPFLDSGDHTVLQPGMVLTIEPGLYIAELGGFRHSDTVVITEDGLELITYYPRDMESLTIPV
ncbi:MAG: aminopeptidase P family protein [Anaerolineales bacterium]|nr:MAG: aminopeptidase P family protein [Anaerolineales bacterium]